MKQVRVINFGVGDFGPVSISLSDHSTGLDSRTAHQHRPGFAPMIAAIQVIDIRCPAKLGQHNDQRTFQHSPISEIADKRRERAVEFTELFDVKIEVLVMGIVVGMADLNVGNPVFQQS